MLVNYFTKTIHPGNRVQNTVIRAKNDRQASLIVGRMNIAQQRNPVVTYGMPRRIGG